MRKTYRETDSSISDTDIPLPVYADDLQDILDANRGNLKTAFEKRKSLAEQGHTTAHYNPEQMCNSGWGINRDYKEAVN